MYGKIIAILVLTTAIFAEGDLEQKEKNLQLKKLQSDALNFFYRRSYVYAERKLQEIEKISKDSIEYYYVSGVSSYSKKNFAQSIMFLQKAVAINENDERSLYLLGMNYVELENWKQAVAYLERAVAVTYNPYYQLNLAIAYFYINENQKALDSAQRAIELKANYTEASDFLSRVLLLNGRKEEAYAICLKNREIAKSDFGFSLHCAGMEFAMGNYEGVAGLLLPRINVLNRQYKKILAESCYQTKRFDQAESLYAETIFTPVSAEEEMLHYAELLSLRGDDVRLEKLEDYLFLYHKGSMEKFHTVVDLARQKKSAKERLYYQFKKR